MTAPPTAHPDSARLAAYGAGRLAPAEAAAVEEHFHGCAACGERMDELARDPFLSALRNAVAFTPPNGSGSAVVAPTVAGFGGETTLDPAPVPEELASHPRYRIGELLGRGGMGAVYKAEHTLMGRPVAVKVIAPRLLEHPGAAERFEQEVKTAARLHHPNIVTAHDAEQVGSVTVLVMEFVEGRTLADVLHDRGPLPVAEACEYARQAAVGLAHAHGLGMVHRDIKPHNLMLTPDGRVKILDFGLARFVAEELADPPAPTADPADPAPGLTHTGACLGTLDYMAPEQAGDARTADARADVYSLGCTLYHLLAGRVPFPGGTGPDKLARLRDAAPPPLAGLRPEVPEGLARLVERMMAKRPEARYESAADVADALAGFARAAGPRPAVSRPRPWKRFAAVAALVVTGVAVALAMKPPDRRLEPAADDPAVTPPAAALPVAPPPRAVITRPVLPELDLIPRDAAGFLTVPVQEVLTAPALAWARQRLFTGGELAQMVGLVTQLNLKDITRATVIWPTADHIGWNVMAVPGEVPSRLVVLTTAAAIDKSNHWLQGGNGNEEYRGRRYTLDGDGWTAIFLADDRTLVFGSRAAVRLVIDRLADPQPGPLDAAVRIAADGPTRVVIGAQGPKFRRLLADSLPQDMQLAAPAYTADRVTLAIDLRNELTIEFLGAFATEAAATDGQAALVKAFAVGVREFDEAIRKSPQDATDPERLEEQKQQREFVIQTRDAFQRAKPERAGTQLRLTFASRSAFAAALVLPGIGYVLMPTGPTLLDPATAGKNDATVAKALLAYHAKHGHFPPPAVLSKEGKPLLSWRVAILPHLGDEAAALYKKFDLDEAWDSPVNKTLLDQMPAELCTDAFKTNYRPRPNTGYRVYTGKGSVFEGPGGRSKADITDDPAATILAARFGDSVPWTKPDRLTFDNLETVPAAAIFADGAVRRLAENEDPNTLKAMITRAGGETVKPKPDPRGP